MDSLSKQIDEAIDRLEYHRNQLVYWRQRKQELEQQIPQQNILQLVKDFLEGLTSNDHDD
jgi:hypothetical protein